MSSSDGASRPRHGRGFPPDDLKIRMHRREDRYGQRYYVARTSLPMTLDLSECTILVFVGDKPQISFRRTRKEFLDDFADGDPRDDAGEEEKS